MPQLTMTLLRHSYSMGNAAGVYSGRSDVDLAPEGEQMVRDYRARGVYERYATAQRYYSSPLRRCLRTLELAFDGGAKPYETPGDLAELDFGELEGVRPAPGEGTKFFTGWVEGRSFPEAPHLESFAQLRRRGTGALERIACTCADDGLSHVTVVLHSAIGRAALVGLAGLDPEAFLHINMLNALGFVLMLDVAPAQTDAPEARVRFVRADPYGPAEVIEGCGPILPA